MKARVLRDDLKHEKVLDYLISQGTVFQTNGAAYEKDLGPNAWMRSKRGQTVKVSEDERSWRG